MRFVNFIKILFKSNLSSAKNVRCFSNYAWQIDQYHCSKHFDPNCLKFNNQKELPIIESPNEILINVKASSINIIDLLLIRGYGKILIDNANVLLNSLKSKITYDKFPLTLGRDFAGIVESIGCDVKNFKKGDPVWGCLSPFRQGSHNKYLVASTNDLSLKPRNFSFEEAASLPYVALTTWSTIFEHDCFFRRNNFSQKRILVIGASGGLGTFAIQLLKSLDCSISVTCSPNAFDLVKNLCNVDDHYDYNKLEKLFNEKQNFYDYIFDFSTKENFKHRYKYFPLLKQNYNTCYITTSPPLLDNLDNYGLCVGAIKSMFELLNDKIIGKYNHTNVQWAFYKPNASALEEVKNLCENGKIKPLIYKIFKKDELPLAYKTMYDGNVRGKIVITFD